MNKPNFSIIIVCKNEAKTVEKTILSVLNQTYKNYEIVVIDGASTDGTQDIIEKYRDKIAYFTSKKDSGIYFAMNEGIKASKGVFLNFLNANDTFFDEFVLEKVNKCLEKYPDRELVFGNARFNFPHDEKFYDICFENCNDDYFFTNSFLNHQSIFYKRELLTCGYNTKFKMLADCDLNLKLFTKNRVKSLYLPIKIANYTSNGFSSNANFQDIRKKEKKALLNKYFPIYHKLNGLYRLVRYYSPKLYTKEFLPFKTKRKINKICAKSDDFN